MEYIPIVFTASDWFPAIITFVIVMGFGLFLYWTDPVEGVLPVMLLVALSVTALVGFGHVLTHRDNQKEDIRQDFEESYNLTIVEGEIPYYPDHPPAGLAVYLNDVPGPQTILVDVKDGEYVVTHNGELREVQND